MYRAYFKRPIEIVLCVVLGALLSWLIILISLVYVVCLEWPAFYTQQRIGEREKLFTLFKFRTLKTSEGTLQQRRFWLGDFLRFLSLDELPQLFNVLKGDMALIGPRALPATYLGLLSAQQRVRHRVRPGITGLAQVNGRHSLAWEEKFAFDIFYVENLSFLLDMKILLKTVAILLFPKKDVSLDERPFTGTKNS